MKKLSLIRYTKLQQGAAIMLFSSVLLFGITSTMLFSARSGIIEQKVTSNQLNAKQARNVANMGLSTAVFDISKKKKIVDATTRALVTTNLPDLGSFDATYTQIGIDSKKVLISVTSKSNDGLAEKAVQQAFQFMSFMDTAPPATLVSGGDVTLSDPTVTLDNKSTANSDATILCPLLRRRGASGNAPIATTVKTPTQLNVGNPRKRTITSGTIPSGDALFESFFSMTKADVKKLATVIDCTSGCTSVQIDGKSGLLWLNGNLSMTDPAPLGVGQWNSTTDTGTPVILIIDGDFNISDASNSRINGLVYITQNWDNLNGVGGRIKGAVVVEGTMQASGILELKYSLAMMDDIIENMGVYVQIPGSWKEI